MADMTIEDELALIKGNKAPLSAPLAAPTATTPAPVAPVAPQPEAPVAADPEEGLPPAETDLPAPPEEAGTWENMGAAWMSTTIAGDAWNYEGRQRNALAQDMFDLLSPAAQAELRRTGYGIKPDGWFEKAVVDAAAKDAAADPEAASKWGQFPISQEAFDARIRKEIMADKAEYDDILAKPGGGFSEFIAGSARAMTTPVSVAAAIAGAFTGGPGGAAVLAAGRSAAWRIIASEALLNAGAEGIDAMTETEIAQKYGWAEPDVGARMLLGAVFGGVFSGAAIGGAKLFSKYKAARAATKAATPNGGDAIAAEAAIDKAEAGLRGEPTGQELAGMADENAGTLGAIVGDADASLVSIPPDAPAGWTEIRNGIFAGESGGDYNALFGYQNRKGGKFSRVRLTDMTVDEAIAFSDPRGAYGQWVKGQIGRVATPMGAYQIVGTTLRAAKRALGLHGDEIMSPELQERLGLWIYRQQGTGAWEGYKGPRKSFTPNSADRDAPTFDTTSRGYTGTGQVKVGDDMTIDVEYQVVDASTLTRASGPYQPRDRSRVNSDAWIADTAARLDPAQLMPSPTADRGVPIVGPDNMIESGNGRFGAIERAYERHPDRAEAYKGAIEAAGYTVPEGVQRPVLIARRRTELSDVDRVKMTVDAQDSGVAVMTPTEMAQVAARTLTPERLDRMDMAADIAAPENAAFLRSFMEAMPRSQRNAMSDADGGLNGFGRRHLREALFARAWGDPDIIELMTEGQRGDLKGLFDALDSSAPAWAALKADIEAGRVLPEMDISGHVLDAMRMIATARRIAARDKQPLARALDDLLNSPDMIEGAVSPLTAALLRKFWRNGRAAPEDEVAGFLTRYADEARKAGASGGLFDAPTPRDVLASIDRATFGDLPEDLGAVRGFAKTEPVTPPPAAFAEGAASPDVQAADHAIRESLEAPEPSRFGPEFPELNGDPEGAIAKLMAEQTGEVPAAITIEGLGPVRFIWGSKTLGLRHILSKHGEAILKDLPRAMREGNLGPEYNGRRDIVTEDTPNRKTVIRLDMDTTDKRAWVLTSHDVIQGTDAQPGRTSNGLTETAPPSVPGATARANDTTIAAAEQAAPDAIQAELAAARAEIADSAADLGDDFLSLDFDMEGVGRVSLRELLDDIDADAAHAAVLRACAITPGGAT